MKTIFKYITSFFILTLFAGVAFTAVPALALQMPGFAANSPTTTNSSYNWAGYVANSGSYTSVSGTWIVPQVTAGGNGGVDATWVGIGGVNSSDLIQAGTQAIVDTGGQVTYQAWYETLPQISTTVSLTVHAGDSITTTINQISTGQWQVSMTDNSTGQSYNKTINYNSSLSSAEWVEEMPAVSGSFIPLDNFGTVQFSNAVATQNGSQITASGADAQPMTMLDAGGQALATVSALGNDGESFTITRTSAAATPATGTQIGSIGRGFGRHFRRNGRGVQGFTPPPAASQTGQVSSAGVGEDGYSFPFQIFIRNFGERQIQTLKQSQNRTFTIIRIR